LNHHDLDFVIEKDGSAAHRGRPLAFIETAWRRYTKHSKNKAQEIQSAILPIAEKYQWDRPFLGAILAGFFTQNSIEQLQSFGFSVLYFEYKSIVFAFDHAGIDVRFDEATTDRQFADCIQSIHALTERQYSSLKAFLLQNNQDSVNAFLRKMGESLDRIIERLVIIPLYGTEYIFATCTEAIGFIESFKPTADGHDFRKYEVMVKLSNGDSMEASFKDRQGVEKFLKYLSS